MLIPREEVRFNFNGAAFDIHSEADRKLIAWIFNQFLYGEATGIQCGHWLYRAPDFNAALFLARQAGEELSHFKRILRIFSYLGERPGKAHRSIEFLASGMMGGTWGEHVAIEMALGEGLVLGVFYAMADTIPHPEIKKILLSMALEEERHVEFGERETLKWIQHYPSSKKLLLGLAWIQILVMQQLKKYVVKKLNRAVPTNHPAMSQMDAFYDHLVSCFEVRIDRLGLTSVPLSQLKWNRKFELLALLPIRLLKSRISSKTPLLTKTYLDDPVLEAELKKYPLSS